VPARAGAGRRGGSGGAGRLLAAFDAKDGHLADGQRTSRTWLVHCTGVTRGQAAEHQAVQALAQRHGMLLAGLRERAVSKSVALQLAILSSAETGTAKPGGQIALWLVTSTWPLPAGGKNGCTAPWPGALSNTSNQPAGNAASTACTEATGSRASTTSRAPSCAASRLNSASNNSGSSAGNCHASPTSARCRWAYSTATVVFPTPPKPCSAATRGQGPSPPVSWASSRASRSSRPASNTGRGGSATGSPATASLRPEGLPSW
jgi:hypothetical protein